MDSDASYRLGDLQLRIMRVLWERSPQAVADVRSRLEGDELAYTTIATMLRKMEARGLVRHVEEGRRFLYKPAVPEEAVTRSMSDDLIERVFAGSVTDAVDHLLDTRDVSAAELDELERLIRQRKQQRNGG